MWHKPEKEAWAGAKNDMVADTRVSGSNRKTGRGKTGKEFND